ncbi:hypothetical protein AB0P21_03100 [Kribbella sp. NPDC056861]|uniref:DUF6985 domain-containing protein n=1 Tax=Kribbella sp. NPDC056861 TaxID=3154857 RepID=UPI0034170855
MEIPGLGVVAEDDAFEGYRSGAVGVPVLGGIDCEFIVQGYDEDDRPEDFHTAIRDFLALDSAALIAARPSIYAHYLASRHEAHQLRIPGPDSVLEYVELGNEPEVIRSETNGRISVTLECECRWEPDRGLRLVFLDGPVRPARACAGRIGATEDPAAPGSVRTTPMV